LFSFFFSCKTDKEEVIKSQVVTKDKQIPFVWNGANIYFLLTDRFSNGNFENDITLNRNDSTAVLRGFMGGDITGITKKIKENYFSNLGVNAIWFTPVVEQIHSATDEGTGNTYPYHGYWTKDWTAIDPNFGTENDLQQMIKTAHSKGIRVLMDVVLNHTGPVTNTDPAWPSEWIRTSPKCEYTNYKNTTSCTLVENLPDILTESNNNVELPKTLLSKWKMEGRLDNELSELQSFFKRWELMVIV